MFAKARLKLTFFYLLIVVCIISVFSLLLFNFTGQHIKDSLEDDPISQSAKSTFLAEAIDQLQRSLIIGDAIVILLAGLLSYWLAGKTLKPIQAVLDAQEQFSANASHELRTPLSIIKTDLEVFLKNKLPTLDEANLAISSSLEEVNRLSGMIENLLILARSKKININIEFSEVDIAKIINSVVKKLQRSAEAKNLSLTLNVEDSLPVMGNEKLLEQLFFNLIQNAISYTKRGGVKINIEAEDEVKIKIQDTGIGIEEKELKNIFKPFYKIDTARPTKSGGVGLGLSIVKDIVDRHHGVIKIVSEVNKGTTVTVTLPGSNQKLS